MTDIARVARVHRSTVSLALRHQSKIPAATRARILKIAQELGYAPDPLLDAFNFQRIQSQPAKASLGIAFVSDLPSREAFEASPLHRGAFLGAKERADFLGLTIDLFLTGPGQLSPARLDRVLQSRGLSGVIVGALSRRTETLRLDWARYCALAIDSFHLSPTLDTLTLDYRNASRHTVQRLRAAGHARIGFVATAEEDLRLRHLPLSGYLLATQADAPPVPPLLLPGGNDPDAPARLENWFRQHRPTGIVAGCSPTAEAVRCGRMPTLRGATWSAVIDTLDQASPAGPNPLYSRLGIRAVELLYVRRQVNQGGTAAHRTTFALSPLAG